MSIPFTKLGSPVIENLGPVNGALEALEFDGSAANYVDLSDSPAWNLAGKDFTIIFWIKRNTDGLTEYVIGNWMATGDQRSYTIQFNTSDQLILFTDPDGAVGSSGAITSTGTAKAGIWTQCAFTSDRSTVSVYINGLLDKSGSITDVLSANNTAIGKMFIGAAASLAGQIAGLTLSHRVMSADEIKYRYLLQLPDLQEVQISDLALHFDMSADATNDIVDVSGNGHDVASTTQSFTPGRTDDALVFNGTSDFLDTDILPFGPSAVSVWAKIDAGTTGLATLYGASASGNSRYYVLIDLTGNQFYLGAGFYSLPAFPGGYDPYSWNHYVTSTTYNGSSITTILYINNVYVGETTTASPTFATWNLYMGANHYGAAVSNNNFKGVMDDVRIYSKSLSLAEISSLYNEIAESTALAYAAAPEPLSYSLSYGNAATSAINWGADLATVQAQLEALPGIGAGNVEVTDNAGKKRITFKGALANKAPFYSLAQSSEVPLGGVSTKTLIQQGAVSEVFDAIPGGSAEGIAKAYIDGEEVTKTGELTITREGSTLRATRTKDGDITATTGIDIVLLRNKG